MVNVGQEKKYLIVIAGPTGVGKTSLSLEISRHFNCPVISGDSRQIYKEMNIGTAKPSLKVIKTCHMKLVDHISIHDEYNAGKFEKEADKILEEVFKSNKYCILCGGTGLYIKAVCEGLHAFPDIPKNITDGLTKDYENHGIKFLQEELLSKDPAYFELVDISNPHRMIRALSICRHTGRTFSSFFDESKKEHSYEILNIVLEMDRADLYRRINDRVLEMISLGLEDEARQLYPYRNLKALQTVGYKELFDYFEGKTERDEAIKEIQKNTRRYAKRQLTWLRKYNDGPRFHPENSEDIIMYIEQQTDKAE